MRAKSDVSSGDAGIVASVECPEFAQSYKRYVLTSLTLVYTLSVTDQGLITLLLEPIKEDLHLSDTQLGFLTGIAFGLVYATVGLPIARWTDRGNRTTITSLMIGLWGVTVMLCLFVSNFIQLVAARVAAAVGEAGCMPPTYSLVGDYFPSPADHTRAMASYMLAQPLSLLLSFGLGGWLNEHFGWRMSFFVMGIPALLIAILVKVTITEPRMKSGCAQIQDRELPKIADVLRTLWRQRSARHLILAFIILYTVGLGMSPWYAAFMMRSHGMGTTELGVSFALIFGLSGVTGVWLGGYVAGGWLAGDECGQLRLVAVIVAALVPSFGLFLLLPGKLGALLALVPLMVACNFFYGPTYALMQRLVGDDMRATTLAVAMFLYNLIGMGIGPSLVGTLSDILRPVAGTDSLRYAMLAISFLTLWASYHIWQAGRTVSDDLLVIARRSTREKR